MKVENNPEGNFLMHMRFNIVSNMHVMPYNRCFVRKALRLNTKRALQYNKTAQPNFVSYWMSNATKDNGNSVETNGRNCGSVKGLQWL